MVPARDTVLVKSHVTVMQQFNLVLDTDLEFGARTGAKSRKAPIGRRESGFSRLRLRLRWGASQVVDSVTESEAALSQVLGRIENPPLDEPESLLVDLRELVLHRACTARGTAVGTWGSTARRHESLISR
jgi:hypothetical protein